MKRRGLITFLFLSMAVFAGLALYGDLPELLSQVSSFPVAYWFGVMGLALANYLFRLARWHYYLRVLDIDIGFRASAIIFFSGLSMAISPGRVGELAKSYYLSEKRGVPLARSAAAVVAERVTDVMGVLLLSLWGLTLVPYGWAAALAVLAAIGLLIAFAMSPWGSGMVHRLPIPGRWRPFVSTSRDSFRQVLSVRPLALALLLAVLAWFAEGCALWLVLRGLDADGSLGEAVSIYAAATLLGAATMLPGGLIGTEGGMVALLRQIGLDRPLASTATFIIRVCTLWFAVAIGLVALVYVQVYMPRKPAQEIAPITLYPDTPGQVS